MLSKRWKGESTILFNLRLDTLNTFTYNKSFVFSDKTALGFSWRAWGDLMSAIVGKNEGYMAYYM